MPMLPKNLIYPHAGALGARALLQYLPIYPYTLFLRSIYIYRQHRQHSYINIGVERVFGVADTVANGCCQLPLPINRPK